MFKVVVHREKMTTGGGSSGETRETHVTRTFAEFEQLHRKLLYQFQQLPT